MSASADAPALIDTHAHLDGPEFAADLPQVVGRATDAGVAAIVSAGQDEATSIASLSLADRFDRVAPAVGVHPHHSGQTDGGWLPAMLEDPRVVAVGETGLDYHYDFSDREAQRRLFVMQLELANERQLPVIIHCREAFEDLFALLRASYAGRAPAVVHCFTEGYDTGARLVEEFGAYLGIGGVVTFKNATALHDAVRRLPLDHLVLETDCPYIAPVPQRGRRNEPSFLRFTCEAMAALRATSVQAIATATSQNARRLFPRLERLSSARSPA